MTRLELAIAELNRKFVAITAAKIDENTDEYEVMESALYELQTDIEKIEHTFDVKIRFDNNYSWTLGIYVYGMYQSLDEMNDIGSIVDSGC